MGGQGLLHKQDMIDLLRRGDFGLTKIQVLAVLSEAQLDEHGFIPYEPLAPLAAQMIKSIWEQNQDLERAQHAAQLHQEQQDDFLFGRARDEVLNETGVLGRALDAKEVQSIMLSIDENDDGKVDYEEFVAFALEILDYYWREQQLNSQQA